MHVNESVEATFGAREHPVDRALLVTLHVVFVEILGEVFTDVFAKCCLDKAQVFLEVLFAKRDPQELPETFCDVIENQSPSSMGMTLSSSGSNVGSGTWAR